MYKGTYPISRVAIILESCPDARKKILTLLHWRYAFSIRAVDLYVRRLQNAFFPRNINY
jgi:hypothetical protein